ncbi:MAG TPA: hypothetical protein VEX38_07980 [Fimbriimonadaceae bacterium]|nr:hypothetical protein [Fimbriimonadaceae bacterium]
MHDNAVTSLRIYLTGAPAAGKTTVSNEIVPHLRLLGYRNVRQLGIEQIHRELCRDGASSEAHTDGSFHYESTGTLILHHRELQVQEAVRILAQRCADADRYSDGFVVEIAHPDLGGILIEHFHDLLRDALVIHFQASVEERVRRNALREQLRMPDEILQSDYGCSIDPQALLRLHEMGARLLAVDTTSVAIEKTLRETYAALASMLPTGCHRD